jgi:hypothetical protein
MAGLAKKGILRTAEDEIVKKNLDYKPFASAKETTFEIVKKLKERASGIPIVAVPVSVEQPFSDQFKDVFTKLNIPYITEPAAKMDTLAAQGIDMTLSKGRGQWNSEGQQLFGMTLMEEISKTDLRKAK